MKANARKDLAGPFHRGHGGARARKVARQKRAIERRVRQEGRKACAEKD